MRFEDGVEVVDDGVPVLHLPAPVLQGHEGRGGDAAGLDLAVGVALVHLQSLAHLVHRRGHVLQ